LFVTKLKGRVSKMEKSIIYTNSEGKEFFIKESDKLDLKLIDVDFNSLETDMFKNAKVIIVNKDEVIETFEKNEWEFIEDVLIEAKDFVKDIKVMIDTEDVKKINFYYNEFNEEWDNDEEWDNEEEDY